MLFKTTHAAKHPSATARTSQPWRSVRRFVTIPKIANASRPTAIAANRTARNLSTPGVVAGDDYPRRGERAIHLHDLQAVPALPPGPPGAERHLAVVLPGGEDRRA